MGILADFALHGLIDVNITGVPEAIAQLNALERELKDLQGTKAATVATPVSQMRKDIEATRPSLREINQLMSRTAMTSRVLERGFRGTNDELERLVNRGMMANRFIERFNSAAAQRTAAGDVSDPTGSRWIREQIRLGRETEESLRLIQQAAEQTGQRVPPAIRSVVKEYDDYEKSLRRIASLQSDADFEKQVAGLDRVGQATARVNRLTQQRNTLLEQATDPNVGAERQLAAARELEAVERRLATATAARASATTQAEQAAQRAREQAIRDEERRAQVAARRAAQEEAAHRRNLARLDTLRTRQAALDSDIRYAQQAREIGDLAVAESRLAQASRNAATAQQALSGAIRSGSVPLTREIELRTNAVRATERLAQAERVYTSAVSASEGARFAQRYAMYDAMSSYGIAAVAGAAAIGGLAYAFGSLESQMTAIQRTGNFDMSNLAPEATDGAVAFGRLQTELARMATILPVSVRDINEMAKVAGQLGVEASGIGEFTAAVTQFAAITDITDTGSIAESFGRIGALLNLGNTEGGYRRIADAISNVGVNAAATDGQIIAVAEELAMAGAAANFTAEDIIGLSGGFASLGIPAERARSVMQDVVSVFSGGLAGANDSLQVAGELMGITAQEAGRLWKNNPADFIMELSRGLSKLPAEQLVGTLRDIGLEGKRAQPVFQALAKDMAGMQVVAGALDDARNSAGALNEQFAGTMDDLASDWQRFVNEFVLTAAALGATLAPTISSILEGLGDAMSGFRDFASTDIGGFIVQLGALAVAAGTAFAAYRTLVAGVAGMSLALQAVRGMSGGLGLTTLLSSLGSIIGIGSGPAASRMGSNLRNAAGGMMAIGAAAPAVRNASNAMGGVARGSGLVARSMGTLRGAGMALSGALGGPVGIALAGTAAGILSMNAAVSSGAASVSSLTTSFLQGASGVEVMSQALQRSSLSDFFTGGLDRAPELIGARQNTIAAAGRQMGWLGESLAKMDAEFRNADGALQWGEMIGSALVPLKGITTLMAANETDKSIQNWAAALGELSVIDMGASVRSLGEYAKANNLSADAVYDLIASDEALLASATKRAQAMDPNFHNLDAYAQQMAIVAAATTAVVDANGNLTISEEGLQSAWSDAAQALSIVTASRMETLTALNAGTQAATNFYGSMDQLRSGVEQFVEESGQLPGIWDSVNQRWNITSTEAGNLALLFENVAASALEAALQFEDFDEANMYLDSARQGITDMLTELGVAPDVISEIVSALQLDGVFSVTLEGETQVVEGLTNLTNLVQGLPKGTSIVVDGMTEEAQAAIEELGYTVTNLPDGTVSVTANMDLGDWDTAYEMIQSMDGAAIGTQWTISGLDAGTIDMLERAGYAVEQLADGTYLVTLEVDMSALEGVEKAFAGRRPKIPVTMELSEDAFTNLELLRLDLGYANVKVTADTSAAYAAGGQLVGYYNGLTGEITLGANIDPAIFDIEGVMVYVDSLTGEVIITAATEQAQAEIDALLDATRAKMADIQVGANTSAAEAAINRTARDRNSTIMALTSTSAAEAALNRLARGRTAVITAVGRDGGAEGTLNSIARNRTSVITAVYNNYYNNYTTNTVTTHQRTVYSRSGQMADGGYTGSGPKWQPMGTYHAGEYIIPKRDVNQSTGLPKPEALAALMGGNPQSAVPNIVLDAPDTIELGPASLHAIARAVKPLLKMDGRTVARGVSYQDARSTRTGAS